VATPVSGAREEILGRIRTALLAGGGDAGLARKEAVRPALQQDPVTNFVDKLKAASASVTRVPDLPDVVEAIADYLQHHHLPTALVIGNDPPLPELAWPADWELARRPAAGDDHVSVTGAFAAIAETGSLVMLSGPGHPTSLNFLPDDHVVVLRASQVVAHMEDVWALLRARDGGMPRTVNIITGPSRTADVEQTIQLGAHGPRRLHVVLVAG
jgi:L-lactate dehydrogenase complex protein LldG